MSQLPSAHTPKSGVYVAEVSPHAAGADGKPIPEQRAADARLIAAAPTLLKAARLALLELDRISYQIRADPKVVDLIGASIAKAEGAATPGPHKKEKPDAV